MNQGAACTVFEGKIVVTVGDNDWDELQSVEAYDYYENEWTYLRDMIEERSFHSTVSMGNKIFVIGGYETLGCEIFDSCSRMFTIMTSNLKTYAIKEWYFEAFCIGNSIVVYHHFMNLNASNVYMYDVDQENWSNIEYDLSNNLFGPCCIKYYNE